MATETCPLCDWESDEKDTVQEARNSVRSHMSSKVDDDHRGVGYQKATQLLDIQDSDVLDSPDASASQAPAPASALDDTDDTRTDVATDGGETGLGLEGKPDRPDLGDADADDSTDELECTDCGDALGVTADELEADEDIQPGAVLFCECGHRMEYSP